MEQTIRYESKRGKFIVIVEGNSVAICRQRKDGRYNVQFLESVDELQDLFVTIASVLNQIYDNDNQPII